MNMIVSYRQPHTPGPWTTNWSGNSVYIKAQNTDRDVSICRVMTHRSHNNLNVLLAAPEMLAALEAIALAHNSGDRDRLDIEIQNAVDVLCRAKGC
jgi:hypothetical protein